MEFVSEQYTVRVNAPPSQSSNEILTPDALRFVGLLCHKFEERRQALLGRRKLKAKEYDAGLTPRFLPRPLNDGEGYDDDWKCAPIPDDVGDRSCPKLPMEAYER